MKPILERLFALRGIRAATVFDKNGSPLASHAVAGDALGATLETMGQSFMELLGTTSFTANATSSILHFEGGTLVLRRNAEVLLAVIGDATFDVSERGAAVPLNVALVALRVGSRRPPRSSVTVPAPGPSETLAAGDLRQPKPPQL